VGGLFGVRVDAVHCAPPAFAVIPGVAEFFSPRCLFFFFLLPPLREPRFAPSLENSFFKSKPDQCRVHALCLFFAQSV